MSKARPDDTPTGRELKSHFQPLALCVVGDRYRRFVPSGYRKLKIYSSSHKLFHQVGGGKGVGEHPGYGCLEVCMEKHNDEVRGTRVSSVRQRVAI